MEWFSEEASYCSVSTCLGNTWPIFNVHRKKQKQKKINCVYSFELIF